MDKLGFFPLFLDIRTKKVVFVGAGNIAARRLLAMAQFDCQIEVIAPTLHETLLPLLAEKRFSWQQQCCQMQSLLGADMVLICTNDEHLNHEIWHFCKQNHILVNNCSNHEECDFYFPGLVVQEQTVVAVNAGGKAHAKAAALRKKIAEFLKKEAEHGT